VRGVAAAGTRRCRGGEERLDNHFNFVGDQDEWKGTQITFEIAETEGRTQVRFAHRGLAPEFECFNVCSNAWGSLINGSLRTLIAKEKD
jgi:hypothetical protein